MSKDPEQKTIMIPQRFYILELFSCMLCENYVNIDDLKKLW